MREQGSNDLRARKPPAVILAEDDYRRVGDLARHLVLVVLPETEVESPFLQPGWITGEPHGGITMLLSIL